MKFTLLIYQLAHSCMVVSSLDSDESVLGFETVNAFLWILSNFFPHLFSFGGIPHSTKDIILVIVVLVVSNVQSCMKLVAYAATRERRQVIVLDGKPAYGTSFTLSKSSFFSCLSNVRLI